MAWLTRTSLRALAAAAVRAQIADQRDALVDAGQLPHIRKQPTPAAQMIVDLEFLSGLDSSDGLVHWLAAAALLSVGKPEKAQFERAVRELEEAPTTGAGATEPRAPACGGDGRYEVEPLATHIVVRLTLAGPFKQFNQDKLLAVLSDHFGVPARSVDILDVGEGSTIVTLRGATQSMTALRRQLMTTSWPMDTELTRAQWAADELAWNDRKKTWHELLLLDRWRAREGLFGAFLRVSPGVAFLASLSVSMVMLLASALLGIDSVIIGGRQVGYFHALNWSLLYSVLVPFFLFFALAGVQSIPSLFIELLERGMLVGNAGIEPAANGDVVLLRRWDDALVKARRWWWLAVLFAVVFSLVEWGWGSGRSMVLGEVAGHENDWSVVHATHSTVLRLGSGVFTFAAGAMQTVAMAAGFYFVAVGSSLTQLLWKAGEGEAPPALVPDVSSSDERRGFEVFEVVFERLLTAGVFAFGMVYLARVENAYLHSPTQPRGMMEFVAQWWPRGDFSSQVADYDISSLMATGGAILLVATCLLFPVFVLRSAGGHARTRLRRRRPDLAEVAERMRIWPLRFPRQNIFVAFVLLASIAVVFYWLGLVCLAVAIAVGFWKTAAYSADRVRLPWWGVAVAGGLVASLITVAGRSLDAETLLVVGVGVAVSGVILFLNPALRYYRLAVSALFTLGAANAVPGVVAAFELRVPEGWALFADFATRGPPWSFNLAVGTIGVVALGIAHRKERDDNAHSPADPADKED